MFQAGSLVCDSAGNVMTLGGKLKAGDAAAVWVAFWFENTLIGGSASLRYRKGYFQPSEIFLLA